ncbi:RING-type domain-containing protein [Entamoeba marina]
MGNTPQKPVISNDVNRMCSEITVFLSRFPSRFTGIRYVYYPLQDNDIAISYTSMLKENWKAAVDDIGNLYYYDTNALKVVRYQAAPPSVDFMLLEQKRLGQNWTVTYNSSCGQLEYKNVSGEVRYTPPHKNPIFKTKRINRTTLVHHYLQMIELMKLSVDQTTSTEQCTICYDNSCNVTLPCGHSFCDGCIITWSKSHPHCPLCHSSLNGDWMTICENTACSIEKKAFDVINS